MAYRIATDHPSSLIKMDAGWQRRQLEERLGICYSDSLVVANGVTLVLSSYTPVCDLIEESVIEKDTATLSLTLGLEGWSQYRGGAQQEFGFSQDHTTVTLFRDACGERHYQAGCSVRQLRLLVDEAALQHYSLAHLLSQDKGAVPARQLSFEKTDTVIQQYGRRLVHLINSHSPYGILDLQITALSLLLEQIRCLLPESKTDSLKPNDRKRIEHARRLMIEQMDQPLTVCYLCEEVGLNEAKLKRGFRQMFATTPYRMLTEIRMGKAKELLESGYQVAQAGYMTGYEHPTNFSAAFTRFYGQSPKSVAKGRVKART